MIAELHAQSATGLRAALGNIHFSFIFVVRRENMFCAFTILRTKLYQYQKN